MEAYGPVWACLPCDARVGTHSDNVSPLGTLADAPLRRARRRAHDAFDPLWKGKALPRWEAYAWLSEAMGLAAELAHIALFDMAQCRRVVELVASR